MGAWTKMTGELAASLEDPEERELAERFDRNFSELFKVVPKANRRALLDMVVVTGALCWLRSCEAYDCGLAEGRKECVRDTTQATLDWLNSSIKEHRGNLQRSNREG